MLTLRSIRRGVTKKSKCRARSTPWAKSRTPWSEHFSYHFMVKLVIIHEYVVGKHVFRVYNCYDACARESQKTHSGELILLHEPSQELLDVSIFLPFYGKISYYTWKYSWKTCFHIIKMLWSFPHRVTKKSHCRADSTPWC